MPFPFISSSSRGKDSSEDIRSRSKWNFLRNVGNSPSSSAGGGSHRRRPFPTAITDQVSTEIYELIIDQLSADKASLLACNLVCRSWGPRSKMLLMSLMICRPAPLVGHNHHEFGEIACAVPNPASDGEIIYGTPGGIYRTFKDGSTPRFFDIRDISQMEVLPDVNLFLGLSGGDFFTWPLSTLQAGSYHWDSDITRLSKHVSFFNVYRSTNPGENHRVCVLKSSSLSGTIKVFNVTQDQQITVLVNTQELYIPRETYSIHFLSRTRLAAALKKGFAVQGGFEMVDLVTSETQDLLDLSDPSLQFASKKVKAMGVFWVSSTFLVCYDKFAFYVDRIGRMSLNDRVMRWTGSASAFALHGPYILTFCTNHVEIWNIETGKLEQKLSGFYHLLNAPDSGEKVLVLSVSCDIAEMIFRDSAV
ncbi:CNH domain-containing protein [Mycena alexandri]|uniref:CNH domain-containing protein n=1 Tax=Mycena alexandri TaxID=1745969 RepID=A0AAD6S827_9AGAR|nr:CNH domain-containing protein [Mycena alexandri]